ncbi:MAG: FAD-dependent oxidoreductase [Acidimicrobiales bacterium]
MRAVVAGAGVGGLASALALSRAGHDVVLLERDDTPMPERLEDAAEWDRQGAPQFHHSHVFLPRLRAILRERFPDVRQALLDAGVPERHMSAMFGTPRDVPGAEDLVAMPCRRTVFEWVLRRVLLDTPGVDFRIGAPVDGVVAVPGPRPTVVGVRLANGEQVDADVVVATTGRRGDVPAWLRAIGVEVPETVEESGLIYMSRFYETRDRRKLFGSGYWLARRAGVGFAGFEADNRSYSITVAMWDAADAELRRHFHDDARYDASCRLLPELAPLVDLEQSRPLTPVKVMGGLANRLRRYVDDAGQPLVSGFFAVGDAYVVTNPIYGRGCTQAFMQATHLADAIAAHPDDPVAQAVAYEADAAREVVPWFHLSVLMDTVQRAADDGSDFTLSAAGPSRTTDDPAVAVAFARVFGMLDPPERLYTDPTLMGAFSERFAFANAPRASRRPPELRLTRDDLLKAAAA